MAEMVGDYDIDELARSMYDVRSQRANPMTDEEWARKKELFPSTVRILHEEARRLVETGAIDDD